MPNDSRVRDKTTLGRYRKAYVRMWGDWKFNQLSAIPPCGQGLWFRLMIAPEGSNIPGLIVASELLLSDKLHWSIREFRRSFEEIRLQKMAKADWQRGLIWLPKAIKYHEPESPNVVRSWRYPWDQIPECRLKWEAYVVLNQYIHDYKGIEFQKAFQSTIPTPDPDHLEAALTQLVSDGFIKDISKGQGEGFTEGFREDLSEGVPESESREQRAEEGNQRKTIEKESNSKGFHEGFRSCTYCGVEERKLLDPIETDHFIPRLYLPPAEGIENTAAVLTCRFCGIAKASKIFESVDECRAWLHRFYWTTKKKFFIEHRPLAFGGRPPEGFDLTGLVGHQTMPPKTLVIPEILFEWAFLHLEEFDPELKTRADIEAESVAMLDHYRSKGEMRVDWIATLRNWLRSTKKYGARTKAGTNGNGTHSRNGTANSAAASRSVGPGGLEPKPYRPKQQ